MDFKLDPETHDLVIEGGDFVMVEGTDDTRQSIKIRLLTIAGEWYLDDTIGWINFRTLFGKPARLPAIRAKILEEIHATPGVLSNSAVIESMDFDATARTLSVTWRCKALNGEGIFDTTVLG